MFDCPSAACETAADEFVEAAVSCFGGWLVVVVKLHFIGGGGCGGDVVAVALSCLDLGTWS